ncbi:hypothetical protein H0H93_001857, partial [Arthromyces matolae]
MPPKTWATDAQNVFLNKHLPEYVNAKLAKKDSCSNKKLTRFTKDITREFFVNWPEEEALVASNQLPQSVMDTARAQWTPVEQDILAGAVKKRKEQIVNWFRNHSQDVVGMKKKSSNVVLASLIKPPKRQRLHKADEMYQKMFWNEKLFALVKEEWKKHGLDGDEEEGTGDDAEGMSDDDDVRDPKTQASLKMTLRRRVIDSYWKAETPEVKQAVIAAIDEEKAEMMRALDVSKEGLERDADQRELADVLDSATFGESAVSQTTFLAAYPQYRQVILEPFVAWLRNVYPQCPDVDVSVLTDPFQDTSIPARVTQDNPTPTLPPHMTTTATTDDNLVNSQPPTQDWVSNLTNKEHFTFKDTTTLSSEWQDPHRMDSGGQPISNAFADDPFAPIVPHNSGHLGSSTGGFFFPNSMYTSPIAASGGGTSSAFSLAVPGETQPNPYPQLHASMVGGSTSSDTFPSTVPTAIAGQTPFYIAQHHISILGGGTASDTFPPTVPTAIAGQNPFNVAQPHASITGGSTSSNTFPSTVPTAITGQTPFNASIAGGSTSSDTFPSTVPTAIAGQTPFNVAQHHTSILGGSTSSDTFPPTVPTQHHTSILGGSTSSDTFPPTVPTAIAGQTPFNVAQPHTPMVGGSASPDTFSLTVPTAIAGQNPFNVTQPHTSMVGGSTFPDTSPSSNTGAQLPPPRSAEALDHPSQFLNTSSSPITPVVAQDSSFPSTRPSTKPIDDSNKPQKRVNTQRAKAVVARTDENANTPDSNEIQPASRTVRQRIRANITQPSPEQGDGEIGLLTRAQSKRKLLDQSRGG